MTQPTPYFRQYAFVDWSTSFPTTPHSGQHMDTEFNAVKTTMDQILVNMAILQRDDGKLHNGIVGVDSLSNEVISLMGEWTPRGTWLTATAYAVQDVVVQSSKSYVCLIAHTSGVFATDLAAGKWVLLYQPGILADGTVSPTADISWGGFKLTNLLAGVAGTDAVNKAQSEAFANAAALAAANAAVAAIPDASTVTRGLARITTPAEVAALTENGEAVSPFAMAQITIASRLAAFNLSR